MSGPGPDRGDAGRAGHATAERSAGATEVERSASATEVERSAGATEVRLLRRPGCHLCDEARDLLLALAAEGAAITLQEVDVEASDDLLRAYLERIPVVEVEGRIVSELVPDADAIRAALHTVGP